MKITIEETRCFISAQRLTGFFDLEDMLNVMARVLEEKVYFEERVETEYHKGYMWLTPLSESDKKVLETALHLQYEQICYEYAKNLDISIRSWIYD